MAGDNHKEVIGGSEQPLLLQPQATLVGSVPDRACGQMTFLKRSSGDIVYIGLKGKTPSPKNYDIILTDTISFYSMDAVVPGDIKANGSTVTGILSVFITFTVK